MAGYLNKNSKRKCSGKYIKCYVRSKVIGKKEEECNNWMFTVYIFIIIVIIIIKIFILIYKLKFLNNF